jgi:2-keto-4-pentenoate hydratase
MSGPLDDPRIARGMQAQLEARHKRITAGDAPLGWKVGFGAPAAMTKFGITAPLVGYLMQSGRVASGGNASLAGWTKPVAEPEIAIHLGCDVAGGSDEALVETAITAMGPAIELADLDSPPEDVEAILAANIYQRHVVVGPASAIGAGGRIYGLSGRVIRRGGEVARTADLEANTGRLVAIVRHVADLLAACGETLRAGEFIIAGSVVAPLFIESDDDEIAFALDPIGEASVRFTR